MSVEIDERLLKIIELARGGIGGERENAVKIIQRVCAERGLSFEDVMRADDVREYRLPYKRGETKIIGQILHRYAPNPGRVRYMPYRKLFIIEATPAEFVQLSHIVAIYMTAYHAERRRIIKAIPGGFFSKHSLYATRQPGDKPPKPMTRAEYEQMQLELGLAEGMKSVQVRRGIGDGKQ